MNSRNSLQLAFAIFIVYLFPCEVTAELPTQNFLDERFKGTGINCEVQAGMLNVTVGYAKSNNFEIDPANLLLIQNIGPIESLVVEHRPGFAEEDYHILEKVEKLKDLQIVHHYGNCSELLRHISKCRGLRSLTLNARKLTASDLRVLHGSNSLTELSLCCDVTSDNLFSTIALLDTGITRLRISSQIGNRPSYSDLSYLFAMNRLSLLEIKGSDLSPVEKSLLRRSLPNCDIRFSPSEWSEKVPEQ